MSIRSAERHEVQSGQGQAQLWAAIMLLVSKFRVPLILAGSCSFVHSFRHGARREHDKNGGRSVSCTSVPPSCS
eukprot:4229174-Pleurochrysis_carterae.AAC.1